jgi:hypothetical protein
MPLVDWQITSQFTKSSSPPGLTDFLTTPASQPAGCTFSSRPQIARGRVVFYFPISDLYDIPRLHLQQHQQHHYSGGGGGMNGDIYVGTSNCYIPMFAGGVKPVMIDPTVQLDRQE